MSQEQVRKLLGGYATGTLTPEEQESLFAAALEDQALFDALAREQSLRDLLRDPAAKAQLLAALDDAPLTWRERASRWMWGHAVGLAAVACFVTVGGYVAHQAHFTPPRVVYVASERNKVEVNGDQPPPAEPAQPRRVFDLGSAKKTAPAPPEMPPPPVLGQRAATVQLAPRNFAVDRDLASVGQPPALPAPVAAPAPQSLAPRSEAPGRVDQSAGTAGAMGGRGGGGARGGALTRQMAVGAAAPPVATEQAAVTAMATPVQASSAPQSPKLADSSEAGDLTLKGRDMFGVLQQTPGVSFGNAYQPSGDASDAAAQGPLGAGKLDTALVSLLQRARSGGGPSAGESRFISGGEANVRMTLTNASADSLAQLRAAGFTIARQDRNELTGHIAVEKLVALTRFAFVVWIAPRVP